MPRKQAWKRAGPPPARLARERETVRKMMRIYCRGHHGRRPGLCAECTELLDYAMRRLDGCPFGEDKPTCANCEIHCYKSDMRERIRQVMRYAGPRMLLRYPLLAIAHKLDDRINARPSRHERA